MSDHSHDTDTGSRGGSRTRPWTTTEALVGGLGALLVVAALAVLLYQAIAVRDGDPQLTTSVTGIQSSNGQYVVHYQVTNRGGSTAEAVEVVGQLTRDGSTVQQVSATLAYVPPDSSRSGSLVFTQDPRDGALSLWSAAYRRS